MIGNYSQFLKKQTAFYTQHNFSVAKLLLYWGRYPESNVQTDEIDKLYLFTKRLSFVFYLVAVLYAYSIYGASNLIWLIPLLFIILFPLSPFFLVTTKALFSVKNKKRQINIKHQ